MKLYNYSSDGLFTTVSTAEKDPLEKDKYLIPAFATTQDVIEEKNGFDRVFKNADGSVPKYSASAPNATWQYEKQFVKCTAYNKKSQGQKEFDDETLVTEDYTLLVPESKYHTFENDAWTLTDENAELQITDTRTLYVNSIDSEAARIYSIWTRFESEYYERETAAKAYKDSNYEDEPNSFVTSFATSNKISNEQAAEIILQQAQLLRNSQETLASQRMRKYELNALDSIDEMKYLYDDIIEQMKLVEIQQSEQS